MTKKYQQNSPVHFRFRQGEEWYRHRTVLIKKTLRPKEVQEYCGAMSTVADDFMHRLRGIVHSGAILPKLDQELFKWALECE